MRQSSNPFTPKAFNMHMEQNSRNDALILNIRDGRDLLTAFTSVGCTRAAILDSIEGNLQMHGVGKYQDKMQTYIIIQLRTNHISALNDIFI